MKCYLVEVNVDPGSLINVQFSPVLKFKTAERPPPRPRFSVPCAASSLAETNSKARLI